MRRMKILAVIACLIFVATTVITLVATPATYAENACDVAKYYDPLICGTKGSDEELELIHRVRNILNVIYLWIGIITVTVIVIGGAMYMTSQGDPEKTKRAKNTLLYAICGLIITLAAFAITSFTIGALQGSAEGGTAATGDDAAFGPNRNKVRSIVSIDSMTLVVGQTGTIKARIVPDYATNKTVTFESDDTRVVTVTNKGFVKSIHAGTATITIKSPDGPTKTVAVTVKKPIPVTSIKLDQTHIKLKKNKTAQVKAVPYPSNATDKTLIWTSLNPKVATVTQSGLIKALKPDESTYITVVARNKPFTTLSKSPDQITLADVEPDEPIAKVQALIVVEVESEFYSCQGATDKKKYNGNQDFRKITRKIIDKEIGKINYTNVKSYLSSRGGYKNYVKSLGGIFKMYAGKDKTFKIKSACDVQAAAEYVYGLWTIWGPDYDAGWKYVRWGEYINNESDGFYNGSNNRNRGAGYTNDHIDEMLERSDPVRTNCNCGYDSFVKKTDQLYIEGSSFDSHIDHSKVGVIHNTGELQVGDTVHFFNGGTWKHIAFVGEVYSDTVVLYDNGGRFIGNKIYKFPIKRGVTYMTGEYSGYGTNWKGARIWNIDQSKTLGGL